MLRSSSHDFQFRNFTRSSVRHFTPLSLLLASTDAGTRYTQALSLQPTLPILASVEFQYLAVASFVIGSILVVSSMYALGITGTYLGDYFGILMEVRLRYFSAFSY